jgi:hypothetical protein
VCVCVCMYVFTVKKRSTFLHSKTWPILDPAGQSTLANLHAGQSLLVRVQYSYHHHHPHCISARLAPASLCLLYEYSTRGAYEYCIPVQSSLYHRPVHVRVLYCKTVCTAAYRILDFQCLMSTQCGLAKPPVVRLISRIKCTAVQYCRRRVQYTFK